MKKNLFFLLFVVSFVAKSQLIELTPNNGFAVCPNTQITYSAAMTNNSTCNFSWEITGGTFQGGGTTATGSSVTAIWSANATSGTLKLTTNACSPMSNNGQTTTKTYLIKSLAGANVGGIAGTFGVNVNVSSPLQYTIPLIQYPKGSNDPNPFYVRDYDWEVPVGWTVISKTISITNEEAYLSVTPDNCNGGILRVRAKSSCGNFFSNWSSLTIGRTISAPGNITGDDQITCSDLSAKTYSINAVTGATSYTWTLPNNWSGSSTTTSITVTPSGLNGGTISVKANGCNIQSSASSKSININIVNPGSPPSISGSSPVCYEGRTFTLSNMPPNSTINWLHSSSLTSVSGQGTTSYTVRANASTTHETGWVEATVTTPCGPYPVPRNNFWVGVPNQITDILKGSGAIAIGATVPFEVVDPNNYYTGSVTYDWDVTGGYFAWIAGSYANVTITEPYLVLYAGSRNVCGSLGMTSRGWSVENPGGCPPGEICEMRVSPNPSSDELLVAFSSSDPNESIKEVKLRDAKDGKVVYSITLPKGQKEIKIPVRSLNNGLYYLSIRTKDKLDQRQIIIKH